MSVNIFKDKHLGDYGFFIWVIPVAFIFFFSFFLLAVKISFLQHLWSLDGVIFLLFMHFICISCLLWFSYEMFVAIRVAQEAMLSNDTVNLVTYFRRKVNLPTCDIASVMLISKNPYLLKKHRAVQTDKPCLELTTTDNKRYLITPHMERFDELKAKLEAIVEKNKSQ